MASFSRLVFPMLWLVFLWVWAGLEEHSMSYEVSCWIHVLTLC